MSEAKIKSVCLASGGQFGPLTGPLTALIDLDDGSMRRTRDRFEVALVHEVLRYQCMTTYMLRHLDGECDCVTLAACTDRVREIARDRAGARRSDGGDRG